MLSSVLLPEPDGPISATNSPRRNCRSRPCSTSASFGRPRLYDLRSPLSAISSAGALFIGRISRPRSQADRLRRVQRRGTPRRRQRRQHAAAVATSATCSASAGGSPMMNSGNPSVPRTKRVKPQISAAASPTPSTEPSAPDDRALQQEHALHLRRAWRPSRAGCRSRAASAPPKPPARWRCPAPPPPPRTARISPVLTALRVERRHQLRIGLLPAFDAVRAAAPAAPRARSPAAHTSSRRRSRLVAPPGRPTRLCAAAQRHGTPCGG